LSGNLYIVELTGLHHDCAQSLLELSFQASRLKDFPFKKIVLITRKITFNRISDQVKKSTKDNGFEVYVLDAGIDHSPSDGMIEMLKYQRKLRKHIYEEFVKTFRFTPRDTVIFVTAEMFASPLLYRIATQVKYHGAKVITEVHNVFIFFPHVVKPEEVPAIRKYYLYGEGYQLLVKKFGKLGILSSLLRKQYLNSFSRRIGELSDGFLLPSIHISFPRTGRPVLRLLTRYPKKEVLNDRRKLLHSLIKKRPVVFTVPGKVNHRTRNYKPLFKAVEALKDMNIQILFNGVMESKLTEEEFRKLPPHILKKLVISKEFVDEETYQSRFFNSHYALIPVEFPYGKFKTTGGIGDAISVGVPIILPEGLIDTGLLPHITYTENNIADVMEKLADLENYTELSENILDFSTKFTIDRMALKFNEFLQKVSEGAR